MSFSKNTESELDGIFHQPLPSITVDFVYNNESKKAARYVRDHLLKILNMSPEEVVAYEKANSDEWMIAGKDILNRYGTMKQLFKLRMVHEDRQKSTGRKPDLIFMFRTARGATEETEKLIYENNKNKAKDGNMVWVFDNDENLDRFTEDEETAALKNQQQKEEQNLIAQKQKSEFSWYNRFASTVVDYTYGAAQKIMDYASGVYEYLTSKKIISRTFPSGVFKGTSDEYNIHMHIYTHSQSGINQGDSNEVNRVCKRCAKKNSKSISGMIFLMYLVYMKKAEKTTSFFASSKFVAISSAMFLLVSAMTGVGWTYLAYQLIFVSGAFSLHYFWEMLQYIKTTFPNSSFLVDQAMKWLRQISTDPWLDKSKNTTK